MKRSFVIALVFCLSVANFAAAQSAFTPAPVFKGKIKTAAPAGKFGSGPVVETKKPDEQRVEFGGRSVFNGNASQTQSRLDPATGGFERRTRTVMPSPNRVQDRTHAYDPKTGDWTKHAVQRDVWTGQSMQARSSTNPFTGERTQAIGMYNPSTNQSYGFVRRQQFDPATGNTRRDVGQFHGFNSSPGTGGFYSNSTIYNPYTGQFQQGYPNMGFWPR